MVVGSCSPTISSSRKKVESIPSRIIILVDFDKAMVGGVGCQGRLLPANGYRSLR